MSAQKNPLTAVNDINSLCAVKPNGPVEVNVIHRNYYQGVIGLFCYFCDPLHFLVLNKNSTWDLFLRDIGHYNANVLATLHYEV